MDYIRDNNLQETAIKSGEPGVPALELPAPPNWADAGARTPEWAYSAILYTDTTMANDPPTVIALMSRLSGDVDPAKVLEYAPAEIKNLPGYEYMGDGEASQLGGYQAVQIGGVYTRDGARRAIAQKTVVIPRADGVYVLQLNADAAVTEMDVLVDATNFIDDHATISQ